MHAKLRTIFLIGAQKAGSSFLYRLLVQAADVVGPDIKEPNYYLARSWYGRPFSSLFPSASPHAVLLDATTAYLHSQSDTASLVASEHPSASIVCIIRDPLERAVSGYLHGVKHGRETRRPAQALKPCGTSYATISRSEDAALAQAFARGELVERYRPRGLPDHALDDSLFNWRYVSNSFYADQLKPWLENFGEVQIVDFHALRREPQHIFDELARRLGLAPVKLDLSVKTNPTIATKQLAMRAFGRNVWNRPGGVGRMVPLLKGAGRLLTAELEADRIAAQVGEAPWVAAARESFEKLRAQAIR